MLSPGEFALGMQARNNFHLFHLFHLFGFLGLGWSAPLAMSCSRYVLLCLCCYLDTCYDAHGGFGVSLPVI